MTEPHFHGSYDPSDVRFLLRPMALSPVPAHIREPLMASGARHYSEMLPPEAPPSPAYMDHYAQALARHAGTLGGHIAALAHALSPLAVAGEVVLVSLARAGTPIGVLLSRALRALGLQAPHYSVSIIRDRGIDAAAMDWILARHPAEAVIFIDGWTGKGAIRDTLTEALAIYNAEAEIPVPDRLAVVADLAGRAEIAATDEDYVMPSSILNAVISGLISRTVLNDEIAAAGGFHGCRHYAEWAPWDVSRAFVDAVTPHALAALEAAPAGDLWPEAARARRQAASEACITEAMARYGVAKRNRLKPGAGEATRAVLRRQPHRVVVRDVADPEVAHLIHLCAERGVPTEIWPDMIWRALTIIRG